MMKISSKTVLTVIFMIATSLSVNAQKQSSRNDSTMNAIKIKNIKTRKALLMKQIVAEDKKRNAVIGGVTPETLEIRNKKQDSVCLQLRSVLVDVELELKELERRNMTSQIIQQVNTLRQNQNKDSIRVTGFCNGSK